MNTLFVRMLRGIPGSSKSTWAKKTVLASENTITRINKDDLRAMTLCGSKFNKKNERLILEMRDALVKESILNNRSVIIDDTNMAHKHYLNMTVIVDEISQHHDVEVDVSYIDFDVPLEVCLERNAKREGIARVPDKVIYSMQKSFDERVRLDGDMVLKYGVDIF